MKLFYSVFYMHFYVYIFDSQGNTVYKNQRSMLTEDLGKYSEDFKRAEACDISSFAPKLSLLVEAAIKDFLE